jgi:hypothetical protein
VNTEALFDAGEAVIKFGKLTGDKVQLRVHLVFQS